MITKLFVTRPTLAAVLVALAAIGGGLAAYSMRVQELPDIVPPLANVIIFYPAASPAEMRDGIVRPIEDQIAGAPHLEHLQSTIQQGFATIQAVFDLKSSSADDILEVQRRVQAAQAQLPSDLPPPSVEDFDPGTADVVQIDVSSKTLSPARLSADITDGIVPAIEQLTGIGYVQVRGLVTPAIEVAVDPKKLSDNNLTIDDVGAAIAGGSVAGAGGIIGGTKSETGIDIRAGLSARSEVARLPIIVGGQSIIRVSDVATVRDAGAPVRIASYVGGDPGYVLHVQKATQASEVDAAKAVITDLPGLRQQFPGVTFDVLDDTSQYTADQLDGVLRTLAEAIALVAIVMLLFLRSWRNAAAVLIAIPTSLCVALVAMSVLGFSIDTVSLLSMTLITGILVDDSIVVLENSERHREAGEEPVQAAILGRLEIGLAAIVITLVDVVVFAPIAYLPGIVGRFLIEFALVVVASTLASLLVSFTITPALAGNWSLKSSKRGMSFAEAFARGFDRVREWYEQRALVWALDHPWIVGVVSLATLGGSIALIWPLGVVGFDFVPAQDRGEIFVRLDFPGGTPLRVTEDAVRAIEREVDTIPDVRSEYAIAGASQSPEGAYLVDGAVGQVDIHLKTDRVHDTDYWVTWIGELARRLAPAGNAVVIPSTNVQGGTSQPIDYVVSDSRGDPAKDAILIFRALSATPGVTNPYDSAGSLAPQIEVSFDRDKARRLGVDVNAAADAIRSAFGGFRALQFETPDGLKEIDVGYPPSEQRSSAGLKAIAVRSATGGTVKVGDFAKLIPVLAPRAIDRVDRRTVVHLTANLAPGAALSNVQSDFDRRVAALHLHPGVTVVPNSQGDQAFLSDTKRGMATAIGLGLVLVFLLMAALYDSFVSPFIIMFSVPLAAVGAVGALALTHETLNAFSLIGTVLLVGLVTKNGILLVDFANRAHAAGAGALGAIKESARVRFRPIIMTTAAMIFGMLPLALGLDPAVAARKSLGIVVIGGLLSSLLLTLLLVPVIYVRLTRDRHA
ncbi:MAG TPA: efflux RND transporter permease subunit [Candidatus Eremiobacteraceae bacterium]